jgi:hypothetical protein
MFDQRIQRVAMATETQLSHSGTHPRWGRDTATTCPESHGSLPNPEAPEMEAEWEEPSKGKSKG